MSGRLGDLSPTQEAALKSLREKISDVITPRCDDVYLLRFLRARQFDVEKAEKKIRLTLEFRKKYEADTILTNWQMPKLCEEYFSWGLFDGLDSGGRPVGCLNVGTFDLRGLLKCCSRTDLIKAKVYVMERMEQKLLELSASSGTRVETVTMITDIYGLTTYNISKPAVRMFNEYMQIEEMHYPEIIHAVYIIRQPKIFGIAYALVKNFIDPHTREKLIFCGQDWKDTVARGIPAATLPEMYGGVNPSMGGAKLGGRVPKEFYKENDEALEKTFVKAGKKHLIEVAIDKPGGDILYEFSTEDHDIGFGIYFGEESDKEYVLPQERADCHAGSVEGAISCEKAGTYVLEFDNSFSWTRGKNLCYRYEVAYPEAPENQDA